MKVHALIERYLGSITVKFVCGRYPEDMLHWEHAGFNKWKGVTCKHCLAKRKRKK
jgi:hypothetical protein